MITFLYFNSEFYNPLTMKYVSDENKLSDVKKIK